jgi:hypothetical protein
MKVIGELPLEETLRQSLLGRRFHAIKVGNRRWASPNGAGRLQAFAVHGRTCVRCGCSGDRILVWEANDGVRHVDLFSKNASGDLVMMTRDHIIPRSKNGPNNLFNYQPMCARCNFKKGNKETSEDQQISKFRNHWRHIHNRALNFVRRRLGRGRIAPFVRVASDLYLYKLTHFWARLTA